MLRGPAGEAPAEHCPLWLLKALQFSSCCVVTTINRFSIVFWEDLGVSTKQIAWLNAASLIILFYGSLLWSSIIDRMGHVRQIMAGTQVASCCFAVVLMLGGVREHYALLVAANSAMVFFMSSVYSVVDAICLAILKANTQAGEGYGQQRAYNAIGCGASSIFCGLVMDRWGSSAMYPFYFIEVGVLLWLVVVVMPDVSMNSPHEPCKPNSRDMSKLVSLTGGFILIHLVMYAMPMSLIEIYLPLFYVDIGMPKTLVGMSVGVMCATEVPVFYAMDKILGVRISPATVLTLCQLALVLRCMLYAVLPRGFPPIFLLVEPLHGVNFAAMWSAVVHIADELAPEGLRATMQALVSGVYFLLGQSLGSVVWGHLLAQLGFGTSFYVSAGFTLAWCAMWMAGLAMVKL